MMANYERILRIVIALDVLLGMVLLLWPGLLAGAPAEAAHGGYGPWPRAAGLSLLLLSVALLPAAVIAVANPYLAMVAALAQALLGLFFLFSGTTLSWLLAIWFFVSAYLLAAAFWRGLQRYLLSKP